jgi:hypothetical protein
MARRSPQMAAGERMTTLLDANSAERSTMLATLSNSLGVARLTNCRSILLSMTANFLRRNCSIICRSPMRKGDR